MNEIITQGDAARRQLVTAIRMFFNEDDLVSVHTLACSARELYEKHCQRVSLPRMFGFIQETDSRPEKELWSILNGARNFFKHPAESLDSVIELRDSDNKAAIFIACHDCAVLIGEAQPPEVQIFNTWFMGTEWPTDQLQDEESSRTREILSAIDAAFPGLRNAGASAQKAIGRRLIERLDAGDFGPLPS